MPAGLVFNALFSSFFVVRIFRGGWMRHPAHLAIAMAASVVALLVLNAWIPGAADSLIDGNLAALGGAWLGIAAYDRAIGVL